MEKREGRVPDYNWYLLVPLIFLLSVVPLIVYLKVVPLSGASFEFWTGQKENLDFFSYYKMVSIIICCIISILSLALFSMSYGLDKIKISVYYIPMAIYAFFVILSTEFSQYTDISLTGFPDRYEGMYILLAYMVILFVTINLVNNEENLKVLIGALFTGALIIGIIGVFQYLGYDFFKSAFGKNLILPAAYKQIADKLQFQFSKGMIYATLYHLDYVGSYMAMLFPLSFTMFLLTKRGWMKVLIAAFSLLMAVNWLGCTSRAGILGGVLALVILMIMMNRYIIKNWKYFIGGIVILCLILVGLNSISKDLSSRMHNLISDVVNISGGSGNDGGQSKSLLQGLDIKGNQATLVTSTETLKFELNGSNITFQDKDNHPIPFQADKSTGKIQLQDNLYKDYQITAGKYNNMSELQIVKGILKLNFSLGNSKISLLDSRGRVVNIQPVARWGFQGKELLGSSRGYIWSRSIPLLKDTIFIGHGPDTFAAYFPQNDFVGKFYAYFGDMWQLVDKPHDFYLQVGINTGIISLLALLSIFIFYIIRSAKLYFRNDYEDFASRAGVGVFVAVCGYLGAAFFNDSVVSVAPVFWILLGLGISINYMLEQKNLKSRKVAVK
ncbi:lipid A core-O-antigen ligase-like enyme [Desulfosporosinus acidiphilus SJ4]|uniref:Lipid A core-O-antigen ligase-like enyme n=1 Tax=Desulfosporosinus acidiphilus (strain DSM 22704 / JCM 16185 / SJ4) TaxID=646529 RepID=I4DBS3_DESAJ|nr:O-antigen ligase family protein [Desulfosporosinus acidiphilus]AFM43247.1 lipid A core-O-antigen ligase-like enyme [Desulfosporosinus acidiphilus SJ4]